MKSLAEKIYHNKSIIYSFINYYIFTIIEALIGFYTISYLTKNILPEDFGMIGLFASIIFFLPAALTFSANSLQAIQIINLSSSEYLGFRNSFISFTLLNSLLILLISTTISLLFTEFAFIIITAYIVGLLQTLSVIHSTELIQYNKPTKYGILTSATAIFTLIFTIIFITIFDLSWKYRIIAIIAAELIFLLIRYIILSDIAKTFTFKVSGNQFRYFISYGFPLFFALIAGWILNQSDRYFILSFFNLEIVGLYSAAAGIAKVILMINQTMIKVVTPIIYKKLYNKKGKSTILKIQIIYSLIVLSAAGGLCIGLYLFGDEFLGEKYLKAIKIIYIMVFAKAIFGIYSISSLVIEYYKKTKLKSILTSLSAAFVILFSFSLIPAFHIYGPALAGIFSFTILTLLSIYFSNKLLTKNQVN